MKIVVNKCYGGFGISSLALKELVVRGASCVESYTPKKYYGGEFEKYIDKDKWEAKWQKDFSSDYEDIGDGFKKHRWDYNIYKDGLLYSLKDRGDAEVRKDKDLVDVVEKLGDRASGSCAKLQIIEIPDDVDFEINEYDGFESIHEKHRSW